MCLSNCPHLGRHTDSGSAQHYWLGGEKLRKFCLRSWRDSYVGHGVLSLTLDQLSHPRCPCFTVTVSYFLALGSLPAVVEPGQEDGGVPVDVRRLPVSIRPHHLRLILVDDLVQLRHGFFLWLCEWNMRRNDWHIKRLSVNHQNARTILRSWQTERQHLWFLYDRATHDKN